MDDVNHRFKDKGKIIDFSKDMGKIALVTDDNSIEIHQLNGSLIKNFKGNGDRISIARFSQDSQLLASSSFKNPPIPATIDLWSLDDSFSKSLDGHRSSVTDTRFSPDGKLIASSGFYDEELKLWKLDGTLVGDRMKHNGTIQALRFNPDGQILASSDSDNFIKLWRKNGTLINTIKSEEIYPAIEFSLDGKMLFSASEHSIVRWPFALESLLEQSCSWLRMFFETHPKRMEKERKICKDEYYDHPMPR